MQIKFKALGHRKKLSTIGSLVGHPNGSCYSQQSN